MQEYEYSLKVKSIKPFIHFCEDNNYKLISKCNENRKVYENRVNRNVIARITRTSENGNEKTLFDFKNIGKSDSNLKVSSESKALVVTEENIATILSMLETLDFYQSADNYRARYTYENDGVKFEIDDYSSPKMQIVGIEGEKEKVDAVYNMVKDF